MIVQTHVQRIASVPRHLNTAPLHQHLVCQRTIQQVSRRRHANSQRVFAGDVRKVDSEELQKALNERQKPIVLDFYATWCGPCLLLAKELEKVSEELGDKIQILKIDTDENPDLSNSLRIEGLPTMVFVSPDYSKSAIRTEGLLPAETIIKIINEELLASPAASQSPS